MHIRNLVQEQEHFLHIGLNSDGVHALSEFLEADSRFRDTGFIFENNHVLVLHWPM